MKKDSLSVSKPLLVKALALSFVLLTLTFGLGLAIGKTDDSLQNITSADEGEVRGQLSACSFKLQEITTKHLSLIRAAKKKGLMDENGRIEKNLVCTVHSPEMHKVDITEKKTDKKAESEKVEKIKEDKKEIAKPEKKKVVEQKEKKKSCSFSIQLFSDPDKKKALSAKKSYPFKGLRLVEAEIRGGRWYRIRYGCYATRAQAELDLPEVKDVVDSAIVVAD